MQTDVAIVGAGLSGLACAKRLTELKIPFVLFDASERVGGRVQTDLVDGYRLDRGFQVLLDSYPEARRILRFEDLGLRPFAPGALVRKEGRFWRVVDPWRAPLQGIATLRAPFVTFADGLRMASLRRIAVGGRDVGQASTAEFLLAHGFSSGLRESFFQPFFSGVTLDPELRIPASYFCVLFGWFAKGSATVPAAGMQAIPQQLADELPQNSIRLGQRVASVRSDAIELESGESVACRAVVVATDASTTGQLLAETQAAPEWLGTTTVYYAAEVSPVGEPILVLNGDGDGPVNHLCVLSDAQPSYAPGDSALISVSVLGVPGMSDEELDRQVRAQISEWYGAQVSGWRLLRTDKIERALPRLEVAGTGTRRSEGVFVCGDHVATPSIQGSLESGRLTAEATRAALVE